VKKRGVTQEGWGHDSGVVGKEFMSQHEGKRCKRESLRPKERGRMFRRMLTELMDGRASEG